MLTLSDGAAYTNSASMPASRRLEEILRAPSSARVECYLAVLSVSAADVASLLDVLAEIAAEETAPLFTNVLRASSTSFALSC